MKAVPEVYLAPGEFRFATCPTRLRTVLGSCVAITLWHPQRKIGGMCHFMLPGRTRCTTALNGKYADEAIELFARKARSYHTEPEEYQLKLFGGGEMFPHLQRHVPFGDVARMNVNAALEMAALYRLDLIAQDMGSTGYRSIVFDLCNGDVWVRHQPITSGQ